MRKWCVMLLALLVLPGCAAQETFETVTDVYSEQSLPAAGEVSVTLPEDAAVMTMTAEEAGKLYLCDGYSVTVQTLSSGNLDATVRSVSGFSKDSLTLLERQEGMCRRYECAWACVGEGGDQVGRAVILDDGSYHYVLSVMADAATAGELAQTIQSILDSFAVTYQ